MRHKTENVEMRDVTRFHQYSMVNLAFTNITLKANLKHDIIVWNLLTSQLEIPNSWLQSLTQIQIWACLTQFNHNDPAFDMDKKPAFVCYVNLYNYNFHETPG